MSGLAVTADATEGMSLLQILDGDTNLEALLGARVEQHRTHGHLAPDKAIHPNEACTPQ